jgi:hypothetical protein
MGYARATSDWEAEVDVQGSLAKSEMESGAARGWRLAPVLGALCAVVFTLAAPASAAPAPVADAAPAADPSPPATVIADDFVFPRRREVNGFKLVIYAPQIRSWPNFERFAAMMAIEITPPLGAATRYATATVQGATEVDLARRIVRVIEPEVTNVAFTGGVAPKEFEDAVRHATRDGVLEVPLELFLASVADDVLANPPPAGFNVDPPAIAVRKRPTILLFMNGEPVASAIEGTGLEVLVNANWPVFRATGAKPSYYLLNRDRWYRSAALEKGWKTTRELPEGFAKLPVEPQFEAIRAAVPAKKVSGSAPDVLYAAAPTELIVTDGRARLEEIPGADGLEYVTNTESPLFRLHDSWYFLAAGRWFQTVKLDKGPWTYTALPPAAFGKIPEDHPIAAVRASVPGTVEAKTAALEALLPTKVTASRGDAPAVMVDYAGDPKFEPIEGTTVARGVNTSFDVLEVEDRYYLLHAGIWYAGDSPTGPWAVAASLPDAIYTIPPSSPAYSMTQVTIASTTPNTVTYSYPAAYSSSTYVVYGVPYYGTGWWYYPWIYDDYYYPYWTSYGHGSWYNPVNGRYGSRSVWYGPYGGYSYTQGYNPRTGRYGFVETAWDSDEWESHGETFNPRTGIGTETDRYYSEDHNRMSTERTVSRGDEWVSMERETDYDSGTSTVERETSRGGSSEMTRQRNADGSISSEGSVTTGSGNEYDVQREAGNGTRTSTITGDSGSVTTETRRQNGQSVTSIEGSGGGQGVSVKDENGRTTIGQSGSGDIYAGHDGNVYKKTDDGWQHYDNGGWQDVERPAGDGAGRGDGAAGSGDRPTAGQLGGRTEAGAAAGGGTTSVSDLLGSSNRAGQTWTPPGDNSRASQLDRDYSARQRSQRQFEQRRSMDRGYRSGGFRSGGFRGGMRGGGRRR